MFCYNYRMNHNQTIQKYFTAWKAQDPEAVAKVFTHNAKYIVRPFGVEEYVGREEIKQYWRDNAVNKQIKPEPLIITKLVSDDQAFIEWETTYSTSDDRNKKVRGIMLLIFKDELILELREHFDSLELQLKLLLRAKYKHFVGSVFIYHSSHDGYNQASSMDGACLQPVLYASSLFDVLWFR